MYSGLYTLSNMMTATPSAQSRQQQQQQQNYQDPRMAYHPPHQTQDCRSHQSFQHHQQPQQGYRPHSTAVPSYQQQNAQYPPPPPQTLSQMPPPNAPFPPSQNVPPPQFNLQQPPQNHQLPQGQQPPPYYNPQQQPLQQQKQQAPPQQQQFRGDQQPQRQPLNLRIILTRDEAGYLFGFNAVLLNQLREQTEANITLTEPHNPTQVLILSGTLDRIFRAFSLICRKLWDFLQEVSGPGTQRPLMIKLAVHGSQCGSIIGKAGAKVKEIRDLTGANIQVSQETLPDSSERTVEISGTGEACLQCTYHICVVLQDSPIRGEFVPYVPQPTMGGSGPQDYKPVFLCGDKAFVVQGNIAIPAPPELLKKELAKTSLGEMAESLASLNDANGSNIKDQSEIPPYMNPVILMQAISNAKRNQGNNATQTSKEMVISAEMVGFIIGKGGSKITEIRRISGAQLHINQDEDTPDEADRVVTISGTEESILLAQFLIQSNIDIAVKERGLTPHVNNNGNNMNGAVSQVSNSNRSGFRSGGFRGNNRGNWGGPRR